MKSICDLKIQCLTWLLVATLLHTLTHSTACSKLSKGKIPLFHFAPLKQSLHWLSWLFSLSQCGVRVLSVFTSVLMVEVQIQYWIGADLVIYLTDWSGLAIKADHLINCRKLRKILSIMQIYALFSVNLKFHYVEILHKKAKNSLTATFYTCSVIYFFCKSVAWFNTADLHYPKWNMQRFYRVTPS